MWSYESVFYQISTLGFCGAPEENDGATVNRIQKVEEWIPHMKKLGINAIYFCPVFYSDKHGYDTRDYKRIDKRLGTNEDFTQVCNILHENGIKIVLDGVFNHVGRGFWAFQDLLENREQSAYKDWFVNVKFYGDNCYKDGLSYEGWEGHNELVKLNLRNEEVINHILESVEGWIREFDIDGLRLDVAYSLDLDFIRRLRTFVDTKKQEFFLLGEMIHGDYNRLLEETHMLHSVTNYQVYKGMWSSFNDMNMFEINYTLEQHFCGMYTGKHLLNFLDNHDVNRIASTLKEAKHLPLVFAMMYGIPGIPCIYYGSEWGITGRKEEGGDAALRPNVAKPEWNECSEFIAKLGNVHKEEKALCYGGYRKLLLTNHQIVFERAYEGERIVVAINADESEWYANFELGSEGAIDLLTANKVVFNRGMMLAPYSVYYWKMQQEMKEK
ncbi:MAG: alpha-amylase family glycosyl hydrolase [Velocimicrobium sp.]